MDDVEIQQHRISLLSLSLMLEETKQSEKRKAILPEGLRVY
jgi:hypothetical protein